MRALIVGGGKLGMRLARSLVEENIEITVLDNDPRVIQKVNNELDVLTVTGNALDFNILRELDIEHYDLIIGTVTSDESNVLITSIAKKLGCKKAIARIRNPEYHSQIRLIKEELDIDYVINPENAAAMAIEKYLLKKYSLMGDEFAGGKVKLVEFNVGQEKEFVNKKLKDLDNFNELLIAAVSRRGYTFIPNGDTELKENDVILVIGARKNIDAFDRDHSKVTAVKPTKSVMILGGGKLGDYLCGLLLKDNIEVLVVEKDYDKAMSLKERHPDAVVIHGDGTDFNVLEEEVIHSYDAFVGATGIDETNILMALSMKEEGITKSVAKISRINFIGVLDKLNLDATFNPSFITASLILKLIRGKDALAINLMYDGNTEVAEIRLHDDLKVLDTPLMDLGLPKGILIAAIVRGQDVLIPNGRSRLHRGDRIIVFCKHNNVHMMKSYFYYQERGGLFNELRSGI
ncbi:Trk system potassium transporter TrkA [Aedoeadaptatus urinae]|uniref:Trk system potassium transporter TrkA n=1 Tax=Aedoeadaptatus urinae TaxID=1871017 RepID=UPI00097D37D0|nr:Trk system potassium transporter TrkA [Peptoniphilus urinae]